MSPGKPSRSDEVIPADEQAAIQAKVGCEPFFSMDCVFGSPKAPCRSNKPVRCDLQVSQYFNTIAPKRAEKPSRSDPVEGAIPAASSVPVVPYEMAVLQKLNADHTV